MCVSPAFENTRGFEGPEPLDAVAFSRTSASGVGLDYRDSTRREAGGLESQAIVSIHVAKAEDVAILTGNFCEDIGSVDLVERRTSPNKTVDIRKISYWRIYCSA